ncbi:helix-turn-helix domain-containing protein [Cytobacillus purgationiresistens]|uniref:helix-turn-helix domain-containing protein n=1 Tax=Cytobacillus purgationiresistens TaxID=863449 RepID=UPI0027D92941|nr:helix-turn-helix domain-containing protein [Cytobacillus purgationiresistens]
MTSGKEEKEIFLKMYVAAVRSGLIAKLGPKNWTTLCVIASHMNEKRQCYPTQSQIAKGLGVSRQTANKYVNDLLAFRWEGKPVIRSIKDRDEHGRWDNTRYTIMSVSCLAIFKSDQVNGD